MISIIIPTFNRSGLLLICLKSIINQTYKDFEILIIDDGSTDDTEKIVSNFDERIIYYKLNKSGNISTLRNFGVKQSRGEFIAFCDDDDIWLPRKLEIQLNYLKDYDLVCTNAEIIDFGGKGKNELYCTEFNTNFELCTVHLFLKNFIVTSSVILRKTILPEDPFDNKKYRSTAEDYALWLKLSLNHRICLLKEPLIRYRIHSNLTYNWDNFPLIYLNGIDILLKYKKFIPKRYKKYANWGIFKLKKDYFKLFWSRKKILKAIFEFLKIMPALFSPRFLLLILNITITRDNILSNFEKNVKHRNLKSK